MFFFTFGSFKLPYFACTMAISASSWGTETGGRSAGKFLFIDMTDLARRDVFSAAYRVLNVFSPIAGDAKSISWIPLEYSLISCALAISIRSFLFDASSQSTIPFFMRTGVNFLSGHPVIYFCMEVVEAISFSAEKNSSRQSDVPCSKRRCSAHIIRIACGRAKRLLTTA